IGVISPALPRAAPEPTSSLSISVTRWPARANEYAVHKPISPAPATKTSFAAVMSTFLPLDQQHSKCTNLFAAMTNFVTQRAKRLNAALLQMIYVTLCRDDDPCQSSGNFPLVR